MINFEDGELVKNAYVIIDGVEYPVFMPEYEGQTPLSSKILNDMQKINRVLITTENQITQNTDYVVPQPYIVGKNDMFIFYEGTLLIPNTNYKEMGTKDEESTIIQFKNWDIPIGSHLEFIYR